MGEGRGWGGGAWVSTYGGGEEEDGEEFYIKPFF